MLSQRRWVRARGLEKKLERGFQILVRTPAPWVVGSLFLSDEVVELWVLLEVAGDEGADDVDFEVLDAGVFEGGAGEGGGDSLAAQGGWDFGVPEGHPSLVVAVEFEPGGFSVLREFEAGLCDFAGVGQFFFSLIIRWKSQDEI